MKLNEAELKRYQAQQAQAERDRQEAMRATGPKGAAPRTPASGNLRRGSLTTLKRVR